MSRREAPDETLRFTITRHAHLPGVRLRLRGDFANRPFESEEAATNAAHVIANGRPLAIERESFPALPSYRGAVS